MCGQMTGLDNKDAHDAFQNLRIDMGKELAYDPFDSEPAQRELTNHGTSLDPTLEYWYFRAILVAWP